MDDSVLRIIHESRGMKTTLLRKKQTVPTDTLFRDEVQAGGHHPRAAPVLSCGVKCAAEHDPRHE